MSSPNSSPRTEYRFFSGCVPETGCWYLVPNLGDAPSARVGHTLTFSHLRGRDSLPRMQLVSAALEQNHTARAARGGDELPEVVNDVAVGSRSQQSPRVPLGHGAETVPTDERRAFVSLDLPLSLSQSLPGPPGNHASRTALYLVGGATPDGACADAFRLDLRSLEWRALSGDGFVGRYEHLAFGAAVGEQVENILVFGGSTPDGNLNEVVRYELLSDTWRPLTDARRGTPPSARTHHACCAGADDAFYVFAGGHLGATPVDDPQVRPFEYCQ